MSSHGPGPLKHIRDQTGERGRSCETTVPGQATSLCGLPWAVHAQAAGDKRQSGEKRKEG